MRPHRSASIAVILFAVLLCGAAFDQEEDAAQLIKTASSTVDMAKQVQLYCQAADLVPKNKAYRTDCEVRKAALINNDRQSLRTALAAYDDGQMAKAKRNANYVSVFDPETHRQAQELLAKINGPEKPKVDERHTDESAVLAQAKAAFASGNLQAARAAAQGITDPAVKPGAGQLLADMDRYSSLVSAGTKHEQAREFPDAERSYRSALELNAHVSSDDLAGRIQQMHTLASAPKTPATPTNPITKPAPHDARPAVVAVTISPEERLQKLLDDGTAAMSHNDLNTAGLKFKQALDLAPGNQVATQKLGEITGMLNRDPVLLEKTLREAIVAFYSSRFEDAESGLNRYLGADKGKKKGAAYFYLGATEAALSVLDEPSRRANRSRSAQANFKQARSAGYVPVEKYVSSRVLAIWKTSTL